MRKLRYLLIAALLALAFTCQAQYVPTTLAAQQHGVAAGIAIVQETDTFCPSAMTCAKAFASNVGTAHTLIYATGNSGGCAPLAATDNNSNTIVNALTYSGNTTERIDYVSSSRSGATTVTGSCAGTATCIHLHIWEVSGLIGTFDQKATGSGVMQTGTALTVSTASATSVANELVLGLFFCNATNVTLTAGGGYSPSLFTNDTTELDSMLTEVKIVSSTGVQTATATAASSQAMDNIIATFK